MRLVGLGYVPAHRNSKHLRDAEYKVRIEFLTAGDYPGDGKPKPVAFPDPNDVGIDIRGIKYVKLETLIELKLASGMTNLQRLKDLADVLELIKTLNLKPDYAENLNPYVREKFRELCRQATRTFVTLWRWPTWRGPLLDLVEAFRNATDELDRMCADGVEIREREGLPPGCVYLATTDPDVAAKYEMLEESEFRVQAEEPKE